MGIVNLVSGGLDSTLVGLMAQEEGIQVHPLFIDYGQRAAQKEWATCKWVHQKLSFPLPNKMDLSGFGKIICSGLTCSMMDVKEEAFTPGRNLLFLLVGSAYAYQLGASSVAIGLLSEKFSLFPDQRNSFLEKAELVIESAIGRKIKVVAPLLDFTKADVIKLSNEKGITGTYSCHVGDNNPCGRCIACLEFVNKEGG
jgi:7-cyano-7-deazaguanine synthase